MSQGLFREEVMQARRTNWLGGISLVQPVRTWVLTSAAGIAAAFALTFLCVCTYTQRSTVTGQLVPRQGLATVMAPATGVMTLLTVSEGQHVEAGQMLGVVTVPRATLASGSTEAAIQDQLRLQGEGLASSHHARLQQLDAQERGMHAQLDTLRRELAQVEDEIGTRRNQISLANEVLQRWRKLQSGNYVSALQVKQQESNALEYTSQMQALQRQSTEILRNIAQVQQQLNALPGLRGGALAEYQREKSVVDQQQVQAQADGALVVTAPVAGVIAAQTVKQGQAVQLSQPLLSLIPGDGSLEAELLVPSRAIGFIAPGDPVFLRYQAFPYQKFGHQRGHLGQITRSALSPGELGTLGGSVRRGDQYYRATVVLARQNIIAYGKPETLKPGMLLQADIIGERRRLIEWIFEPLLYHSGSGENKATF
ncbi:HlyD family secretion protein [Xanthomonas sacchari]|uniref:HlyD family secretion protein n=1 Tax=Xanthomonas sacchari TaxID=56458 RepID=UPI00068E9184|nr:HlyD family efflux transporter periplasmic adaptor subunit [Xanthomonas sacchari]